MPGPINLVDVVLLVILGAFVLFGLWFGAIHAFGSLVGVIVGSSIAGLLHVPVGNWLGAIFGNPDLMKSIAFVVIFLIIGRLVGFVFFLFDKAFSIITHLPFIHSLDRLLGMVIGFFEGVLVIGVSLFVISKYNFNPAVIEAMNNSELVGWFMIASLVIQPLLPQALKQLKSMYQ